MNQPSSGPGDLQDPNFTHYLLSCLNDIQDFGPEEFGVNFKMAEDGLQHGRDSDTLRFICLSLHAEADYKQFKQGRMVLEQYITEHPDSADDIYGLNTLIMLFDEEIIKSWSAWNSLREDNMELTAEIGSLQKRHTEDLVLIEELQKQIEQLKNIENIIKGRETEQP